MSEITSLSFKAIEQAIKFLQAAGATYTIKLGDDVFTNTKKRPDYKGVYGPAIAQAVANGESSVSVIVPEEFDLENFRSAMVSTLIQTYGKGNAVSDIERDTRKVSAIFVTG